MPPPKALRGSVHEVSWCDSTRAVAEQFGPIRMPVLLPPELHAGRSCAAPARQLPRHWFDVIQFREADGIDRALFGAFPVYLLSGDRPIAKVLPPPFVPLAQVFNSEFGRMTLVRVTVEDLEQAHRRPVFELRGILDERDKEFLMSAYRGEGNCK